MKTIYVENGQSYNGRPIREGQCPHCGSDDLETDDQGLDDNTYYYEMQCNSCGGQWTDIYVVQFSSMYIKSKETDQ
jgi:hypothetical protein